MKIGKGLVSEGMLLSPCSVPACSRVSGYSSQEIFSKLRCLRMP